MFFLYRIFINIVLLFSPLIILIRLLKKKKTQLDIKKNFVFLQKKRKKENLFGFMERVSVNY